MKVEVLTKSLVTAALVGLVVGTATPAFAKPGAKGEKAVKCAEGENCKCDHAKGERGEKCAKCEKCAKDGCGKDKCGKDGCPGMDEKAKDKK